MYANENNEQFPSDTAGGAMKSLNMLYTDYVSDPRTFNCPSDTIVTTETNAGISAGSAFGADESSYGYDRAHTQADDADVALAADRPSTDGGTTNVDQNSPNHGGTYRSGADDDPGRGQNVVYVDGHVEFVTSKNAGWYDSTGSASGRDNIFTDDSTEGTDTYIEHDGS
jgi:prepilin-type processing-associated H-X9-DG protein